MKRALVLLLLVGVVVAAACSSQHEASHPASTVPAAAPAAVPGGATVAEFPDYPGAVRVSFSEKADKEHGFARKVEVGWTAADPFATVVAYYQKIITDGGWTVTGTETDADEREWELSKGTSLAKVEIKQEPGVPVTIQVERSDR